MSETTRAKLAGGMTGLHWGPWHEQSVRAPGSAAVDNVQAGAGTMAPGENAWAGM
jgi:hypothetical protein